MNRLLNFFFLLKIYKETVVREDLKKPEVICPKRHKCQVIEKLFFPSSMPGTSGCGESLGKRLADGLVII